VYRKCKHLNCSLEVCKSCSGSSHLKKLLKTFHILNETLVIFRALTVSILIFLQTNPSRFSSDRELSTYLFMASSSSVPHLTQFAFSLSVLHLALRVLIGNVIAMNEWQSKPYRPTIFTVLHISIANLRI
jgi:hypothetical protein